MEEFTPQEVHRALLCGPRNLNPLVVTLVSLTGDRERCVLLFDQHTLLCFEVL